MSLTLSLRDEILSGLFEAENDLENPVITWNGNDYACVPSVSQFTRELETGGFIIDKLLTITIPLIDVSGNETFTNGVLPEVQQKIFYQGERYRLITKKLNPTGAFARYTAMCDTRGI